MKSYIPGNYFVGLYGAIEGVHTLVLSIFVLLLGSYFQSLSLLKDEMSSGSNLDLSISKNS